MCRSAATGQIEDYSCDVERHYLGIAVDGDMTAPPRTHREIAGLLESNVSAVFGGRERRVSDLGGHLPGLC